MVGFEPVGQVLGTAVYKIGYRRLRLLRRLDRLRAEPVHRSVTGSRARWLRPFGPLVQSMYKARHQALARADAGRVRGARRRRHRRGLAEHRLVAGGGLEFKALGTAVRAPGKVRPRKPFSSHVSGQEFAKLLLAGYVPTGLALGISIASRHDDWLTRATHPLGAGTPRGRATRSWSTTAGTTRGTS